MGFAYAGACRGDGKAYCGFRGECPRGRALTARFSAGDVSIDVPVFTPEEQSDLHVVVFPLMEAKSQRIALMLEGVTVAVHAFSGFSLKWESRANYRLHADTAHLMRDIEQRYMGDAAQMSLIGVYPYDSDHRVVRILISYPHGTVPPERLDESLLVRPQSAFTCELQHGVGEGGQYCIVASFRVGNDAGDLLWSIPASECPQPSFLHVAQDEVHRSLGVFAERTRDAMGEGRYARWFTWRRPSERELEAQRTEALPISPLISIVIPAFQPPLEYLDACIGSVAAQTYAHWELVLVNASPDDQAVCAKLASYKDERIKVVHLEGNRGIAGNTNEGIRSAQGDYVAFVDQDDAIEPDALYEYVRAAAAHPEAGAFYCDEDSFTESTLAPFGPVFKADFDIDQLYGHNYMVHMLMVSRDVLNRVELSPDDVSGAQDYDLSLKACELAPVVHVPKVLYHWRKHRGSTNGGNAAVKPYAVEASVRALERHFDRMGIKAQVRPSEHTIFVYESLPEPPEDHPLVSILIPVAGPSNLLEACVRSILLKAGYSRFEILLVTYGGAEADSGCRHLKDFDSRIRLCRYEGMRNHSGAVNFGAEQAKGDVLLLLDDTAEAITDGFLRTMLGYFQRAEVGVVGPLLLYRDGLVQHAGIAAMRGGGLGFMNRYLTLQTHGGYWGSLECPREYSAVAGACQMVRKATFNDAGGYDERMDEGYADVDFCWRVRERGLQVVYTSYAKFYHYEPVVPVASHDGQRATQAQRDEGLLRQKWPQYFAFGDPCLNPECAQDSPYYKLPAL